MKAEVDEEGRQNERRKVVENVTSWMEQKGKEEGESGQGSWSDEIGKEEERKERQERENGREQGKKEKVQKFDKDGKVEKVEERTKVQKIEKDGRVQKAEKCEKIEEICTEGTRRTRTQKVRINRQMIQIFVNMNVPKEFLLDVTMKDTVGGIVRKISNSA